MKKILLILFIVIIIIYFLFIKNNNYTYKNDLKKLGYSKNEINIIEKEIIESDIKKYLLKKKYDNLVNFIYMNGFNIKNINRYENYYLNNNISFEKTILYVEIGLDNDFYTNIIEINNYNDLDTLVNKYHKLPNNFNADNLVNLDNSNMKIKKEVYNPLIKMIKDAKKDNINLNVISAYRTSSYQNMLFNNSKNKYGINHALKYSAKKDFSEHQTGYAVDLNSTNENFSNTKEYIWLKNNAFKYGFIERYPKNKEHITGYGYEPWHYRYVGTNISTKIYTESITLEEYYVLYK